MNNTYNGFFAIIGKANVGKSTILNALVGERVSIVSRKPQTTRNKVQGILTKDDKQMVFIDTPGYHLPRTKLGEFMVKEVKNSLEDTDAIVMVTEVDKVAHKAELELIGMLEKLDIPVILVVNKIDMIKKDELLTIIAKYDSLYKFNCIIPICAKTGEGIDDLYAELEKHMVPGPFFYDKDMITNQNERDMVAEIIREKALRLLHEEIPHGIAVEIMEYKEDEDITRIEADIFCEKESHKSIIIGKKGEMLKKISTFAREDIEELIDTSVYLRCFVKVRGDWRDNATHLKNFGYSNKK